MSKKNVEGIIENFEKGFKAKEASKTRTRSSEIVKSAEPKVAELVKTRSRSATISESTKPNLTPAVKGSTKGRSNSI